MIPQYTYPVPEETFVDRARELFSFEGRIGRQSYWLRSLALWGVNAVAAVLFTFAADAGAAAIPMLLIGAAFYFVALFGSLATTVKRLHDRGRSGWFMLIALIPLVGLWLVVEVGFLSGQPQPNEYGDPV